MTSRWAAKVCTPPVIPSRRCTRGSGSAIGVEHALEAAALEQVGGERVEEPGARAEDHVDGRARDAGGARDPVDADRLCRRLAQLPRRPRRGRAAASPRPSARADAARSAVWPSSQAIRLDMLSHRRHNVRRNEEDHAGPGAGRRRGGRPGGAGGRHLARPARRRDDARRAPRRAVVAAAGHRGEPALDGADALLGRRGRHPRGRRRRRVARLAVADAGHGGARARCGPSACRRASSRRCSARRLRRACPRTTSSRCCSSTCARWAPRACTSTPRWWASRTGPDGVEVVPPRRRERRRPHRPRPLPGRRRRRAQPHPDGARHRHARARRARPRRHRALPRAVVARRRRAPLRHLRRRATPTAPGSFLPAGRGDRWVLRDAGSTPRGPSERTRRSASCERIRAGAGIADLDVSIERTGAFSFAAQLADRFRAGNVFLAGDAAHRVTPRGGTGMNTAIRGGHDLGWKLGWVLRGWAGPELLDTYEAERRPIAAHNVARSADPGRLRARDAPTSCTWTSAGASRTCGSPPAGGRVSTLDLLGPGLTLFTGPDSAPSAARGRPAGRRSPCAPLDAISARAHRHPRRAARCSCARRHAPAALDAGGDRRGLSGGTSISPLLAHPDYTRERVRQVARLAKALVHADTRAPDRVRIAGPVGRIPLAEAAALEYRDATPGMALGPLWATWWLRVEATVPAAWDGEQVDLLLVTNSEADAVARRRAGPGPGQRRRAPRARRDARRARGGGRAAERARRDRLQRAVRLGRAQPAPQRPAPLAPAVPLERCELARFDPRRVGARARPRVLVALMDERGIDAAWRGELLRELNRFCNASTGDRATWPAARAIARPLLARRNGDAHARDHRDRPRPHRHGVAVAARGDLPQVRAHASRPSCG